MAKWNFDPITGQPINNGGYSNNNNNANKPQFKKSGFKVQIKEDGAPICFGWKKTKGGMIKLYARPSKGTHAKTSKSGKTWLNLFVTITNETTAQVTNTSGLYCKETQRLFIGAFGWVGSTKGAGKTASGKMSYGYLGKFTRKN